MFDRQETRKSSVPFLAGTLLVVAAIGVIAASATTEPDLPDPEEVARVEEELRSRWGEFRGVRPLPEGLAWCREEGHAPACVAPHHKPIGVVELENPGILDD